MQYISGSLGHNSSAEEKIIGTQINSDFVSFEGTLGYRMPSVGMQGKDIPSFIAQIYEHGILIIDIVSEHILGPADDSDEYWITETGVTIPSRDIVIDNFEREIQNRLKQDGRVYDRRTGQLKIVIGKVLVFCNTPADKIASLNLINPHIDRNSITSYIRSFIRNSNNSIYVSKQSQSLIEGTKVFAKARKAVLNPESTLLGDLIDRSMDNTFTLDEEQRKVSMQIPSGPQRIRGLAGTGKTVILALKAALTHKEDEKLRILSVFNTQSMYNQIHDLITKYYTYETRSSPDWSVLEVMHAWGGKGRAGFYYSVCKRFGLNPFAYGDVKNQLDPLEFIFTDLLRKLKSLNPDPYYDMVLIDEAQDFPQPFFEVIYLLTKNPKRIIWAYDEFQSLNELKIKEPRDLFGLDNEGNPNIPNTELEGTYIGGIEKDFILSNCYRNPRITLMTAHGLGLGIYRKEGIVDILSDNKSWSAIGYRVLKPNKSTFKEGDQVEIERPETFSKNILEKILKEKAADDKQLVSFESYSSWKEEYDSVAQKIHTLISTQGISPEQIMVITLATLGTGELFGYMRQQLDFLGVKSITPGYIESADTFQEKGFVNLLTPYRAKGNEANIVFVTDAQFAITNTSFRSRNAAFVSITRSRGYCYISGNGRRINELAEEIRHISNDYPRFNFKFPSEEELKRRRVILNKAENEIEKSQRQIDELISKNPEILIETLRQNPDLLSKIIKKDDSN
ncbi:DEAD/DEAH box helicase [Hymenobacter rigui]|uniref:Uncharacterized protein n=1 Tax=Hymenobacter rigui TaxID=334424 RepID=A0A3R9MXV0_9BACT|nr:ATP-binding domain-containing protein [Hymenobacter rigui]RSK51146.1 hypothetical protein EI291_02185 [Hymenobacter rigui]